MNEHTYLKEGRAEQEGSNDVIALYIVPLCGSNNEITLNVFRLTAMFSIWNEAG